MHTNAVIAAQYATNAPQVRQAALAPSVGDDGRTITGIAVPLDTPTRLAEGLYEIVKRGAVRLKGKSLCHRHGEPVGVITDGQEVGDHFMITARLSDTQLGRDVATLIRDGAMTGLSIGFQPIKSTITDQPDGSILITHTSIDVREVSTTPVPAYPDAQITAIREQDNTMPTPTTGVTTAATTADIDQVAEIRTAIDSIRDDIATIQRSAPTVQVSEPAPLDTRSIGDIVKALACGDADVQREVTDLAARAYAGTTQASSAPAPSWIGDLTRIVDLANPVAGYFQQGGIPAEGTEIEHTDLDTNSVQVAKQAAEGDTLAFGKVTLKNVKTAIATHGGYTDLSMQAIQRSRTDVLSRHWEALARAAGVDAGNYVADAIKAIITANAAKKITLAALTDWKAWNSAIIKASLEMRKLGVSLDFILADPATFEAMANMEAGGRPLMDVSANGNDTVGTVTARTLGGSLLQVPVKLFYDAPAKTSAMCSMEAARFRSTSLVHLQDSNITNLTHQLSVYRYAAFCPEISAAIIPVGTAA